MRIAIIGTGISGGLTARLLATRHEVVLFESRRRPGGHAHTVDVALPAGHHAADVGFMVFNERTYPNFCRLLRWLGIATQASDMSFSVSCARTGWEYQGSTLNGIFAQRGNCLRPSFLRMLLDVWRFNRLAMRAVADGHLDDGQTVGQFLRSCRLGNRFLNGYLVPMAAAIWSSRPRVILDFPAAFLVAFFANHGLLQLRDRPQWRTVAGGSRSYVSALLAPIRQRLRLGSAVAAVRRNSAGVTVVPAAGPAEDFDHVVFASHADQTLAMLTDATPVEREVLGAFPYQSNEAVLHTDTRLLPRRRRAWASWNYRIPSRPQEESVSVTYDLSRLQCLATPSPLLLTLNAAEPIESSRVLRTFTFEHPAYGVASLAAQRRFDEVSGQRGTHFCGAYWGYGFHEDGVNSALAVARAFGIELDACTAASTKESSFTAVTSP
jgi:predicted NAD/FAD-binding protein